MSKIIQLLHFKERAKLLFGTKILFLSSHLRNGHMFFKQEIPFGCTNKNILPQVKIHNFLHFKSTSRKIPNEIRSGLSGFPPAGGPETTIWRMYLALSGHWILVYLQRSCYSHSKFYLSIMSTRRKWGCT